VWGGRGKRGRGNLNNITIKNQPEPPTKKKKKNRKNSPLGKASRSTVALRESKREEGKREKRGKISGKNGAKVSYQVSMGKKTKHEGNGWGV